MAVLRSTPQGFNLSFGLAGMRRVSVSATEASFAKEVLHMLCAGDVAQLMPLISEETFKQDNIDDLQEKLDHLTKARASGPAPATGSGAPAKASASVHKPEVHPIWTPTVDASAKAKDEGITEIKTPAVLAQEAKARLDNLLKPKGAEESRRWRA
eukprot:s3323_g8.t1